jgi:hypothetical protein
MSNAPAPFCSFCKLFIPRHCGARPCTLQERDGCPFHLGEGRPYDPEGDGINDADDEFYGDCCDLD